MKRIIGIDPGPMSSAWIIYRPGEKIIFNGFGKEDNGIVEQKLVSMAQEFDLVVIEKVVPYINPHSDHGGVSNEVMDTAIQIGRFTYCADLASREHVLISRKTIATTLTGSQYSGDPQVRAALIKKFGEKGTLKNPGPCYGISNDVWSALAVATAYCMKNVIQDTSVPKNFQPGFL